MSPESQDSALGIAAEEHLKTRLREACRTASEDASWLDGLGFKIEENILIINFIHAYYAAWFKTRKQDFFEKVLSLHCPEFVPAYSWPESRAQDASKFSEKFSAASKTGTDNDFFRDFIVNEKNEFSLELAKRAADCSESIQESCQSPIFLLVLCGPAGSGKSHLLKSIQLSLAARGIPALSRSAASFCADYAINHHLGEIESFWRYYNGLLIDDLRDIASDPVWQGVLARFIDEGLQRQACRHAFGHVRPRLVFAFSGRMAELAELESRLAARLEKGLVTELCEPDLEVRLRYLEKNARKLGLSLDREQSLLLARQCATLTKIGGQLEKIKFFVSLRGRMPTLLELDNLDSRQNDAKPLNWQDILTLVTARLNLKVEDVLGLGRKPDLVLARQIIMYISRQKLGLSYPDLGRLMGGRDHSTAIHSVKKIHKLRETDKVLHKLLTDLERTCS